MEEHEELHDEDVIVVMTNEDGDERYYREEMIIPIGEDRFAVLIALNDNDRLNTWITHIGSAVFAVPPGTSEVGAGKDQYWGASLLES